jgi:hypothetical protein
VAMGMIPFAMGIGGGVEIPYTWKAAEMQESTDGTAKRS